MNEKCRPTGFRWTTLLRPRWTISLFLAVLVFLRVAVEFVPTRIEIGPETTVIDGPLRPDGTVDYAAVLDEHWSAGVTPEENAVVDLVRAFGPDFLRQESLEESLSILGLAERPPAGPFAVSFKQLLEEEGIQSNSTQGVAAWGEYNDAYSSPWTVEERPRISRWLALNEQPLRHIVAASRKSAYYYPNAVDPSRPYLFTWIPPEQLNSAVGLLGTKAMLEVGSGRPDQAIVYALAGHRLARLVSRTESFFYPPRFQAAALECDEAIVLSGGLSLEEIRNCREEIAMFSSFVDPVRETDVLWRYCKLDNVQAAYLGVDGLYGRVVYPGKDPEPGEFDPNITMRICNQAVDDLVSAWQTTDRTTRMLAVSDLERRLTAPSDVNEFDRILGRVTGGSVPAGRAFADVVRRKWLSSITSLPQEADKRSARQILVETGYALAEYRAVHGEYPPSLDAMVPGLLASVPLDPFIGAPLCYRRILGRFVLYSVGENETDDGGVDLDVARDLGVTGDDLAFGLTPERPGDE